jgi:hypothetical protein
MKHDISIKDYIKKHNEQLSAMGVLAALAALVSSLTVSWIGYLLSFLMLSCLVLIWSEVDMGPNERSSIQLGFFKFFLKCSFWLIVLYILISHRAISWFFLFVPFSLFFMIGSINIIRHFKILTSFFDKHRVVWAAVVIILMFVSFLIGSYLSIPANIVLDGISQFNIK